MSIFNLEVLDGALEILNGLTVLLLPLLSDLLLIDHHSVRPLLVPLMSLLHIDHYRLQVSYLLICVILDLVQSVMLVYFAFLVLGHRLVFLISQLISQISQSLILVKESLIILHIPIKLNVLLVKLDLRLLMLLAQ